MESCIKTLEIEIFLTGGKFRQGGIMLTLSILLLGIAIGLKLSNIVIESRRLPEIRKVLEEYMKAQ